MSKTETRVAPITAKAPPTWIQKALDGERNTNGDATTIRMSAISPEFFPDDFLKPSDAKHYNDTFQEGSFDATHIAGREEKISGKK